MLSTQFTAVALAGAAIAFTPPGFQPESKSDLAVAFGNTLAINGVDVPKAGMSAAHGPRRLSQLI